MNRIRVLVLIGSTLIGVPGLAYHDNTHRRLSRSGYVHSVLSDAETQLRLGLHGTDKFPGVTTDDVAAVSDLLATGGVSEDYRFGPLSVVTHFFDPSNGGRGLSPCPKICVPSPDWALEDRATFQLQDSSFVSARQQLFRALSLASSQDREAAFGKLFETLGRIAHHLQDMAQPQHTRNDIHIPPPYPGGSQVKAAYELITEKTYGVGPELLDETRIAENLNAMNISVPRDLWEDAEPGGSVLNGKGIAQYANRNFVTFGTNFGGVAQLYTDPLGNLRVDAGTHTDYVLPSGFFALLSPVSVEDQAEDALPDVPIETPPDDGLVYWVGTNDFDALLDHDTLNPFSSKLALNAEDLAALAGGTPVEAGFALGQISYEEARKRLLPKAVAYSAALLNYFFRGVTTAGGEAALRLEVVTSPEDGAIASVSVRNNTGRNLAGGHLHVFYDSSAANGARTELVDVVTDIDAGQSAEIGDATLWAALLADMVPDGELAFVYDGSLLSEVKSGDDPYAVAARVCDCDQVAADPSGADSAECAPFCRCRYLTFSEGSPGEPGDGVSITPTLVGQPLPPRQELTPSEPLVWTEYPDGVEITAYSKDRTDLFSWTTFGGNAAAQTCGSTGTGKSGAQIATVETNGVVGRRIVYTPADLALINQGSLDSGCRFRFCYGPSAIPCGVFSCQCAQVTIDAVKVCPRAPSS